MKVVGVVALDDLRVDGAGGDVHGGHQRHGAVADVLELAACRSARAATGRVGCLRDRAWIPVFSSTLSSTVSAGGSR